MKPHFPHPHLHISGEQLQQGSERWADLTWQGWKLLFDRAARRQAWLRLREHRLRARRSGRPGLLAKRQPGAAGHGLSVVLDLDSLVNPDFEMVYAAHSRFHYHLDLQLNFNDR
ncbi:hypothetical protein [Chromobacterium alticapitis]|uniref:hypothetical protein n=1 Tax=Chromobacterium alticapitis TaxID=2073169 RepID=UPI0011B05A3F|nr:hypothetical protein [Chromobacterium alticapitis]